MLANCLCAWNINAHWVRVHVIARLWKACMWSVCTVPGRDMYLVCTRWPFEGVLSTSIGFGAQSGSMNRGSKMRKSSAYYRIPATIGGWICFDRTSSCANENWSKTGPHSNGKADSLTFNLRLIFGYNLLVFAEFRRRCHDRSEQKDP